MYNYYNFTINMVTLWSFLHRANDVIEYVEVEPMKRLVSSSPVWICQNMLKALFIQFLFG